MGSKDPKHGSTSFPEEKDVVHYENNPGEIAQTAFPFSLAKIKVSHDHLVRAT